MKLQISFQSFALIDVWFGGMCFLILFDFLIKSLLFTGKHYVGRFVLFRCQEFQST
jgi:hypothetical protein